jgi:cell wall-associated NlpC family hydrolase
MRFFRGPHEYPELWEPDPPGPTARERWLSPPSPFPGPGPASPPGAPGDGAGSDRPPSRRRSAALAVLAASIVVSASGPAAASGPESSPAPRAAAPVGVEPGTVLAAPGSLSGDGTVITVGMPADPGGAGTTTTADPGAAAQVAIDFALAQIGLPYLWGGDGPQAGDAGFDCSGLTHAAFAAAGVALPRTAHTQYHRGPHVAPGSPLLPGDLVFYGVPSRVHHVGLYLGGGRMVNAPRFGKPVQIAPHRWPGDDYLGATRPAAGGAGGGSVLAAGPGTVLAVPGGGTLLAAPPLQVALLAPAVDAVQPPTVIDLGAPPPSAPAVPADPPAGLPGPPVPPDPPPSGGGTVIAAPAPQSGSEPSLPAPVVPGPPPPVAPSPGPGDPGTGPGGADGSATPPSGPIAPVNPGPVSPGSGTPTSPSSPLPGSPPSGSPPSGSPLPSPPAVASPSPSPSPPPAPPTTDPPSSDPPPPPPSEPPRAPDPIAVVSGGQLVDVVEATQAPTGRILLVVGSLPTWPEAGATVVLVAADGTEWRATVVSADPVAGELLVTVP